MPVRQGSLRSRSQLAMISLTGIVTGAMLLLLATVPAACGRTADEQADRSTLPDVVPNDNRQAAGRFNRASDTLTVRLVVQRARWRPESDTGPSVVVAAFAVDGQAPAVPAPLLRVRTGTTVIATVRNLLPDSTIGLIGLHAHPSPTLDTVRIRPGDSLTVRFAAGAPGTYLYRAVLGTHVDGKDDEREQLGGAFVVDERGGATDDRVFVMNIWGRTIDSTTYRNALAINGRSWPWTERVRATVGDTLRWRIVNASSRGHPMHLHGAYFSVTSHGSAQFDSLFAPDAQRLAVTQQMREYETMSMKWAPLEPGHWLFHCHLGFHVIPEAARLTPVAHGNHDTGSGDPLLHMAGLVLGIDAAPAKGMVAKSRRAARRMDLWVQEGRKPLKRSPRSLAFVLQQGAPPNADSITAGSPMLVMTQNEPTDVVVHNRLKEGTAVHWHGLELESYSDGVAGWSGTANHIATPVAASDSFVAHLTLRRPGTFIYHTHLNDLEQLTSGLYGALVVMPPGQHFDSATDHVFVAGWDGPNDPPHLLVNGDTLSAVALTMRRGETHRFRFVNIGVAGSVLFRITSDTTLVEWRAVAKDGADLPVGQATLGPSEIRVQIGETRDFSITPTVPGTLQLKIGGDDKQPPYVLRLIVP